MHKNLTAQFHQEHCRNGYCQDCRIFYPTVSDRIAFASCVSSTGREGRPRSVFLLSISGVFEMEVPESGCRKHEGIILAFTVAIDMPCGTQAFDSGHGVFVDHADA